MAVLVTGAGIVGCQVARQLVERGQRPVLYDLHPRREHVESLVPAGSFDLVQGDVRDAASLAAAVAAHRAEAVVHTAALLAGPSRGNPRLAMEVNIGGALNVLELARQGAVRRVVLCSSTTMTYPAFDSYPDTPIPEDFVLKSVSQTPTTFYSVTKLSSELFANLYRKQFGVDLVVVRYAAVLGAWKGENVGFVARMLSDLIHAGRQGQEAVVRDPLFVWNGIEEFIDARDAASGTVAALDHGAGSQHVYNLSSDRGWTLDAFTDVVRQVCPGLCVRYAVQPTGGFAGFPLVRRTTSDISAAARDLDWRPRYSLRESVEYFSQLIAA